MHNNLYTQKHPEWCQPAISHYNARDQWDILSACPGHTQTVPTDTHTHTHLGLVVIDVAGPRRVHWRACRARSQYEWRRCGWMVMAPNVVWGLPGACLYVTPPVATWRFPLGNYFLIACQTCITAAQSEFKTGINWVVRKLLNWWKWLLLFLRCLSQGQHWMTYLPAVQPPCCSAMARTQTVTRKDKIFFFNQK